jgi:hypothetical protein
MTDDDGPEDDDGLEEEAEDLHVPGPCCACGRTDVPLRNILMLPQRAPVDGTGWGCFVCGLESNGAVAVVCDACLGSARLVTLACHGYATSGERARRADLREPWEHDRARHEEQL